jgi:hypothetical protein
MAFSFGVRSIMERSRPLIELRGSNERVREHATRLAMTVRKVELCALL